MKRRACRAIATLAALAACNLAVGCGRGWPTVRPTTDKGFRSGTTRVLTVDVLPIDVALSTRGDYKLTAGQIVPSFDQAARVSIAETLGQRQYRSGAYIDWDGRYATIEHTRAAAMTQPELWATAQSLSSYGAAQAQVDARRLLLPHLPARLGTHTLADATLYVGGFGYVGKDKKVNVGKVLGLVVVGVFVAIVLLAVLSGKGGSIGRATGNAVKAAGHTVRTFGDLALRGLGRATVHIIQNGDALVHTVDALGRVNTHVYVQLDPRRSLPRAPQTGPSRMHIEMTLIDNKTGRTLWHARQTFRANPARPKDVRQVMSRILKTLPRAI